MIIGNSYHHECLGKEHKYFYEIFLRQNNSSNCCYIKQTAMFFDAEAITKSDLYQQFQKSCQTNFLQGLQKVWFLFTLNNKLKNILKKKKNWQLHKVW